MGEPSGFLSSVFFLISSDKTVSISMPKAIKFFVFLTIISFYLTLILGCAYTFTCSSYIPSPHYLGSFLGFNRFYMMSFVLLTISLSLLYICIYIELSRKCSLIERLALKYIPIITCILMPLIALTNEVNSSHFISFPTFYTGASYTVFIINLIWIFFVEAKMRSSIKHRGTFLISLGTFSFLILLWIIVIFQRNLNYKTESWFINTTMWAIFEWGFLTLSLIFISIIGNFANGLKVTISSAEKVHESADSIEMKSRDIESKDLD